MNTSRVSLEGAPTEQARYHGGKMMCIYKQIFFMPQGLYPGLSDQRLQLEFYAAITQLYYRHAAFIFRTFDRWKDIDEYYFIELKLDMAFVSPGMIINIANPPYHLGTIVRNSIAYPQLFSNSCSNGHRAYAYTYNGSPYSKVLKLMLACPTCGMKNSLENKGWIKASSVLKLSQAEDFSRLYRIRKENPSFKATDLRDLLRILGIPEQCLILPRIEPKVTRKESERMIILKDPFGGVRIEDKYTGNVVCHQWHGLKE